MLKPGRGALINYYKKLTGPVCESRLPGDVRMPCTIWWDWKTIVAPVNAVSISY
jgi:hypothetical protein